MNHQQKKNVACVDLVDLRWFINIPGIYSLNIINRKIKEYYHYLCAERKGYIDKDTQLVKWLNFDEEIYINNKSSSTGEASHDIIETDDIDNSGIIKKRKVYILIV